MKKIHIKRGLNIPIEGAAHGEPLPLHASKEIAYNLDQFDDVKFRLLVDVGANVRIGEPLAEDKDCPGRLFVAPAAGVIKEIRRGAKRRLLSIVIDVQAKEESIEIAPKESASLTQQELIAHLMLHGLFTSIRARPFGRLANPNHLPRSIFVKALESAPFMPRAELQLLGHETAFQEGLNALKKLTAGPVYLIHRENDAFSHFKNVEAYTISGPHPASNPSVHIHYIDPIKKQSDVVWTVSTLDVIQIGTLLLTGRHHLERVVAIAGTGIQEQKRQFVRARLGQSISSLIEGRLDKKQSSRIISGNPLTGTKVEESDFLGIDDTCVAAIHNASSREPLHFFRLGYDKYSASGAYLSGHLDPAKHSYEFTTLQHGEERAFIDGSIYQDYMPMRVLVMQLIRAIMSEDFELAEEHGLLEVVHEDFALPEFADPCKIPMMEIVKAGLQSYAKDVLG